MSKDSEQLGVLTAMMAELGGLLGEVATVQPMPGTVDDRLKDWGRRAQDLAAPPAPKQGRRARAAASGTAAKPATPRASRSRRLVGAIRAEAKRAKK